MSKSKYIVRDAEAGNVIEYVDTLEEGLLLIQDYEQQDRENECYTPNFYECVEVENEQL